AEADAELARHNLRQRGLAQPGRADEQHVVERFLALARRLDEDAQVGARLLLADELLEPQRPQRGLADVLLAALAGDKAGCGRHFASSLRPSRIRFATWAPSPASRVAAAMAAAACGWP